MVDPEFYAMTLDEIAKELGISISAVRQAEQRGLKKLKARSFKTLLEMRSLARHLRDNAGQSAHSFVRGGKREMAC